MTDYSDLFSNGGGGGANPYVSGNYYPLFFSDGAVAMIANRLYLVPFIVRSEVTIDEVIWYRTSTVAGNVYVGIVDEDGLAVTDCAVESATTSGPRKTATTSVTLKKDKAYYFCITSNAGVSIANAEAYGNSTDTGTAHVLGSALAAGFPELSTNCHEYAGYYVSRTAALISGTIDITTGASFQSETMWGGFRVE